MNQELMSLRTTILRSIRDLGVDLAEFTAACACMALSQSVSMGKMINAGKLDSKDVPTNAPGTIMSMLADDQATRDIFLLIAKLLFSTSTALNRPLTFSEVAGIIKFNTQTVPNEQLKKVAEYVGPDAVPAHFLGGPGVPEPNLAAAWFWMFQIYHGAGEKLGLTEVLLPSFTDLPEKVVKSIQLVMQTA